MIFQIEKKNKLTDEVVSRIEFFLEENKQKIALGQFKQQIILKAFLEGKSQRQIAKEVGINRKTVKKNIIQYAKAKKELKY